MSPFLFGVLAGGRSTRMGGEPKGLLAAPDTGEPLVARLARTCREAAPNAPLVLVGGGSAYAHLELELLPDDPSGVGPIGGLRALATEGVRRGISDLVVLACDLPHVTTIMVTSLIAYHPETMAVAPRLDSVWQPLFARYHAAAVLPVVDRLLAEGRRSLWSVLDALDAAELPVSPEERALLRDWDSPADLIPVRQGP